MNKANYFKHLFLIALFILPLFSRCTVNIEDDNGEINEKNVHGEIKSVKDGKITRQILKKKDKTIEKRHVKGDPPSVRALDFSMHSGYFKISGGGKDIAEIIFVYEDTTWKPAMNFIDGERLKMKMPNRKMEDFELNIDKDFSTDEPLRSCGVKLGDLSLEEIELKLGAGSGSFDFSNTRVEELEIEFGVGELEITMGSSSPRIIELDAGIGDVFLDLTGDWKNDLKAYIQGGIGSLKVLLPRTCNLQIEAGGLMGDIDAREFNKNGKNYHRASDENNDITLYIDIVGAIGEIELELE